MDYRVCFNDSPTLHQIMHCAGKNIYTAVRIPVEDHSSLMTQGEALDYLDLELLDDEYKSFIGIYYDRGTDIDKFKMIALQHIRTVIIKKSMGF